MPRVRVVVSDEKKDRWNEYAEESTEYDNLSDLVRKSVEKEIHSSESETREYGDYEEIYSIMETVEEIKKQQSRIQDSIYAHRQNALTENELDQLEMVVTEALWDFADLVRDSEGGSDD